MPKVFYLRLFPCECTFVHPRFGILSNYRSQSSVILGIEKCMYVNSYLETFIDE